MSNFRLIFIRFKVLDMVDKSTKMSNSSDRYSDISSIIGMPKVLPPNSASKPLASRGITQEDDPSSSF